MATVDILIKATDQASSVMHSVKSSLDGVTDGQEGTRVASINLRNTWTELNSQAEIVQSAMRLLGEVYQAVVGDTMAYAKTVRDMSDITGTSAEETSRLIQMTDDFGLEMSELETALRGAAMKGIVLTTDKLAAMSDEF